MRLVVMTALARRVADEPLIIFMSFVFLLGVGVASMIGRAIGEQCSLVILGADSGPSSAWNLAKGSTILTK